MRYNQEIRNLFAKPETSYKNDAYVYFPQKKRIDFEVQRSPREQKDVKFSTKGAGMSLQHNGLADQAAEIQQRRLFTAQLHERALLENEL